MCRSMRELAMFRELQVVQSCWEMKGEIQKSVMSYVQTNTFVIIRDSFFQGLERLSLAFLQALGIVKIEMSEQEYTK